MFDWERRYWRDVALLLLGEHGVVVVSEAQAVSKLPLSVKDALSILTEFCVPVGHGW